jgi:hypothetical protein
MAVEELEAQATDNLRQAFSVVGILEHKGGSSGNSNGSGGEDDFLELIHRRIAYVDTSLNPHVVGKRHHSNSNSNMERRRCERVYLDWHYSSENFQKEFRAAVPLLAVAERLYQVGVEVHRHQQDELEDCEEEKE